MRKEHKNPKGGLTAKGRAYFKRKEGANLLGVSRYLYEMKTKDNVEKDFGHTGIM